VTYTEGGSSKPFSWRDETQFRFKNSLRVKDGLVEVRFLVICRKILRIMTFLGRVSHSLR
jgi:hypothetical protein